MRARNALRRTLFPLLLFGSGCSSSAGPRVDAGSPEGGTTGGDAPWAVSSDVASLSDAPGADASGDLPPPDASVPDGPSPDLGPPPCQRTEQRITEADGDSLAPSLVWTGNGYGLAWEDFRDGQSEVYFVRLDAGARKVGNDVRVTTLGGGRPSLVWTGTGYGVAFGANREPNNGEIYFRRLDLDGRPIGEELRVTNAPSVSAAPSLVWNGDGYGLVWNDLRDGNFDIYFAALGAAGAKSGDDVRVTTDAKDSFRPWIAWKGDAYGVVWNDDRDGNAEIYFVTLDRAGAKQMPERRLTNDPGLSLFAQLVWTGAGFGVGWNDLRDGKQGAHFRTFDAMGAAVGQEVVFGNGLPDVGFGRVASVGDGFAYTFAQPNGADAGAGAVQESYLVRLDRTGTMAAPPIRVTPGTAQSAVVVWAENAYGLAWPDTRHGKREIYFARMCP